MDLGLNESQQMLKNSASEFLEKECPATLVREMEEDERGFTTELWQNLADQGWLALILPEQYGGVALDFVDLCILLEEMGRALLPGPFFTTVLMGGLPIMRHGSDAQKQEFLPKIAEGQLIMTTALTEPSARWDASGVETRAVASGGKFTINGTKLFVPNAHVADTLIVVARTSDSDDPEKGITCFLVPRTAQGVSQTLLRTVASDRQSEVALENVVVDADAVLGKVDEGWPIIAENLQYAAIAKCAEMVGGAQKVLDMTVEYAKQRIQFGRPIGSFQAVQHHCANMATLVEGSKYITYQAAWRIAEELPSTMEVAMAKAWVSDGYRQVCALGHQCHGAIGFTKEHDLQLYSRRAKAQELAFGDGDFHREVVAQAIGL